jgi:hypothetical protein
MNAASSTNVKGAATTLGGDGGQHAAKDEARGSPGSARKGDPGGAADEQRREDGASDEPAGETDREGGHLADHEQHHEAEAQGGRVLDHHRQLRIACEHRQRQQDADDPEGHAADGRLDQDGRLDPVERARRSTTASAGRRR